MAANENNVQVDSLADDAAKLELDAARKAAKEAKKAAKAAKAANKEKDKGGAGKVTKLGTLRSLVQCRFLACWRACLGVAAVDAVPMR